MAWWLVSAGCTGSPVDSTPTASEPLGPDPWADVVTELDPFRPMLEVPIGEGATSLASISRIPALAVWPLPLSGAALLDARYGIAGGPACLDVATFVDANDGVDRRGSCDEGYVELDRTHLATGSIVRQVVDDAAAERILVLVAGGGVRSANKDLMAGNPYDWLRLGEEASFVDGSGGVPRAIAPAPGGVWGLTDAGLVRWNGSAEWVTTTELGSPGRTVVADADHAWVRLADGLVREDGIGADIADPVEVALDGVGGVWVLAGEGLVHVSAAGEAAAAVPAPDATGALAVDPRSGKVYYGTAAGVAAVDSVGNTTVFAVPAPVALAANASDEISALGSDGIVRVYADETALLGRAPLSAWVATFFENPRQEASEVDCSGSDDAMQERAARAIDNRRWLDDTPATLAIAISTAAAAHGKRCEIDDDLRSLSAGDRVEPGVLFHDPPDCSTQSCLDDESAANLALLTDLDIDPLWISGAAGWETGGGDWVATLDSLGLPHRHAFLGMDALAEVGLEDPRAKDGLPWAGEDPSQPWRMADAATADADSPGAELLAIPGSTLSVFSMSGCPGALQAECKLMGLGGGDSLEDDDLAVADLLLHRAIANRDDSGRSTWYFHLPALENWDYGKNCTEADRLWSGDTCQAGRVQRWLIDVSARLVHAGVARWGRPSEAEAPG